MRRAPVGLALIAVTVLVVLPIGTADGAWVFVRTEHRALLAVLPGTSTWHLNTTHSPGDLWTLNLSVSGSGFNPLTVLIADDPAYTTWCTSNATTGCLVVARVNWTLHAQVAFPHTGTWHLVLANPYAITLLYSLTLTLYRWSTSTDPTGTLLDRFSTGLGWLITVGVLIVVVLPCVCSCVRRHGSHATHYEEITYDEITD